MIRCETIKVLREQNINDLKIKLTSLSEVLKNVQEQLKRDKVSKKYNEYDIELKLKKYNLQYDKLKEKFKNLEEELFKRNKK